MKNPFRTTDYRGIDLRAETIRSFLMFIGFGRSGHSIVGQVVNAHPNALVADEAPLFDDIGVSFSVDEAIRYLKARDKKFARRKYRKGSGRDFRFRALYQGYVTLPSVLGFSKAGYTSRKIAENPDIPSTLEQNLEIRPRFICIVRNPFDMIASGMRRREANFEEICANFEAAAVYLESSLQTLQGYSVLKLRQEDFLMDPETELERMFSFLELPTSSDFKKSISDGLFASPDKSRSRVPEIAQNRSRIERLIQAHEFFRGYSYDS